MPFLTARWSDLCLFTYPVPAALLEPLVPAGLSLDLRNGEAFVSLVAFDFLQTKVLGVAWPGYRNFPEINLRFYVRHNQDRGVVFIKEFVPKKLIAMLARKIYNEPYSAVPMSSRVTHTSSEITVEHRLTFGGRENRLMVIAKKPAGLAAEDSVEHFFKEHQWGYGQSRGKQCIRYQVTHPQWETYPVISHEIDWDWAGLYGPEFGVLASIPPCSIILAVGSEISVFPKGKLPS